MSQRSDRLAVAGAIAWLAAPAQFLLAHLLVESAWPTPYSWAVNNVSDLGNVVCQEWDGRAVCSPLHPLMNASFVLSGVLIVVGTVCLWWARPRPSRLAAGCLGLAGVGWMLAGLAPPDVDENLHLLAALGVLFAGNAGLLLLARSARSVPWGDVLRWAAPIGLVSLAGAVLFFAGHDLGLGHGGMERVAAYGVPVWTAAAAVVVLARSRRPAPQATAGPARR